MSETKPVTVSEAKARLSALLDRVAAGQRVILGRRGRPEFEIVALRHDDTPRTLGQYDGPLELAEDFDEPMDDLADLLEGVAE